MLKIENLHGSLGDKPILKGLTLALYASEIHAIMGSNEASVAANLNTARL